MNQQEALKTKERLRHEMEANVQEAMRIMRAKGRPITRMSALRAVKCGTVERISRIWAEESSRAPLSVTEFRALLSVFNEVIDEMIAQSGE